MLNVGSIGSSAGMAGYMTSLESQLEDETWQGASWGGAGADALGLAGSASAEAIQHILEGRMPVLADGTYPDLVGAGDPDRRHGTEFIMSAPKSVSIMAVTYGDKRLIAAHHRAEAAAMAYAEKEAAQARIKEKGVVRFEKTGNLVYARSTHGYDDAGKPHLHSHVAIANMTQTRDGKWRALDNSALWANSAKYGANYLCLMADEVRKLGYTIELHKNGKGWDIADVPKDIIADNASRSTEIKAAMAAFGEPSYGANRVARFETRANIGKDNAPAELNARNRDADRVAGFDGETVMAKAAARVAAPTGVLGVVRQTVTQVYRDLVERLDTSNEVKLSGSPYLPASIRSVTQSPALARAYIAMAHAIQHNEQREAAFLERTVFRDALNLQLPGVTLEMLDSIMAEHKAAGLIIEGRTANPNNLLITTKASIEREQAIIANVMAARGTAEPVLPHADVAAALEPHLRVDNTGMSMALNAGQLEAAQLILSSRDGIVLVQGFSGTGKTSTIGPVAAFANANGHAIFGIAPSKTAVDELSAVGLASNTITAFLNENRPALAGNEEALAVSREKYAGATLIVDEASMIGNHDFRELTALHGVLGLARTVFVGDKRQLQAVDQGKAFEIVQTMPVARAQISDVVRQRDPALKAYNEAIRVGDVETAFEAIRENVHEVRDGYLEAAVDHYLRLGSEAQASTLLITAGNADRQAADRFVQSALLAQGVLKGEGHRLTVYDDKGLTDAEMRRAERYAPGDVLRVARYSPSLDLRREDYAVEDIKGAVVRLVGADGSVRNVDMRQYQGQAAHEAAKLLEPRQITVHVGDRIRWTSNDNARDLVNNKRAEVTGIDADGLSFRLADGRELTLGHDDPQLARLDLAYAVNAHKVQGASAPMALWATPSDHKLLTTLRQAYVNGTRAVHQMHVYTDSTDKLLARLAVANSDKLSALEVTGGLDGLREQAFGDVVNDALQLVAADARGMDDVVAPEPATETQRTPEVAISDDHPDDQNPGRIDPPDDEMLQASSRSMMGDATPANDPVAGDEGPWMSMAHMVPLLIDQNAELVNVDRDAPPDVAVVPLIPNEAHKTGDVPTPVAPDPMNSEPLPIPERRLDYDIS